MPSRFRFGSSLLELYINSHDKAHSETKASRHINILINSECKTKVLCFILLIMPNYKEFLSRKSKLLL